MITSRYVVTIVALRNDEHLYHWMRAVWATDPHAAKSIALIDIAKMELLQYVIDVQCIAC